MVPAKVQIGKTRWKTAMFPKNASHIVPIKASVRKAEDLDEGSQVIARLEIS